MKSANKLRNMQIGEESAQININPGMFDLSTVCFAANNVTKHAYFLIDGNPEKELIVTIYPKKGSDPLKIALLFNDELINTYAHKQEQKENKTFEDIILTRLLLTNNPSYFEEIRNKEDIKNNRLDQKERFERHSDITDDPEKIKEKIKK
jgi:hypothetical protein